MFYTVRFGHKGRPKDVAEWKRSEWFALFNKYVKCQYENSIQLGWDPKDIMLCTNFPYSYKKLEVIRIHNIPSYSDCAVKYIKIAEFYKKKIKEEIWVHDLDCWQLAEFSFPKINKIGICKYALLDRVNTGSIFLAPNSEQFLHKFSEFLDTEWRHGCDEKGMAAFLNTSRDFGWEDLKILNIRYNLNNLDGHYGSSFAKRYRLAQKPILCAHFHPDDIGSWRLFCEGIGNYRRRIVTKRLYKLFLECGFEAYNNPKIFFPDPSENTKLSIRSWRFNNFPLKRFFCYIINENEAEVFKIWRIWCPEAVEKIKKDLANKKQTATIIIGQDFCRNTLDKIWAQFGKIKNYFH